MTVIHDPKPLVVLAPRTLNPGEDRFDAWCKVDGCGWTYPADKQFMALKTDASEAATRHRKEHRAAAPPPEVGDLVTVGAGKTVWRIESFWSTGLDRYARLTAVTGYANTSAETHRLKPVTA